MKKFKKLIYPFIFSVIFFIVYIALTTLLTCDIPFPYGCPASDAWEVMFGSIWDVFIIPIFCVIYGKLISKDKFKILYMLYNSIVLSVSHFILFNFRFLYQIIVGFTLFIVWTSIWTIGASGPFKKKQEDHIKETKCDNLGSKKKITIILSSFIIVVALIISSIFVFKHYWPTHYPYDDDFIIGNTEEQIIEKYGEFDRQIGLKETNSVYSKCYLIHEASGDILFGSDYNTWYVISFKNGIAQSVSLRTVDKAA